jgi:hypothetical protein
MCSWAQPGLDKRMGDGHIRHTADGLDFQDAQIGLPTLEAEQGIRVQTALIRRRERGHRRTQAGLANRIDVLLLSFTSLKVNISRCFLERFYLSFKGLAVD